ncbi:MAG TPA: sulfatase-like hydrolase/transferase, partial [Erysipelothrix sp.]
MNLQARFKQFLLYFLPVLSIEILFRVINKHDAFPILWARSLIHALFLGYLLFFINKIVNRKIAAVMTTFVFSLLSLYAFFQTGIKYYYGHFFSLSFLLEGTPDVKGYAFDFLKYIKGSTYLFIALLILSLYTYYKYRSLTQKHHIRVLNFLFSSILLILFYLGYILSLTIGDPSNIFEDSLTLYKRPYYTENALNQLGMSAFIPSDIRYSLFATKEIEEQVTIESDNVEKEEVLEDLSLKNRVVDDTVWLSVRDKEENQTLKSIDNFFLNQDFTPENEMTGLFSEKNFIYILVEAFDSIAIHPTLTPTLYKLKTEGLFFNHFYSPQFNCATAESELISLTSLYPVIDTCTMSAHYEQASPQTLFNLFKKEGYKTSSFHNWNDEFYPRSIIHPVLGSEDYRDVDSLIPYLISGWQSDLTMMEGVVDYLNDHEEPFMSYIITSSTHLPYDEPSELGLRYQNLVKEVYPEAPLEILTYLSKAIELDKAMAYLLENLADIDNTVIALFADHRPLKMPAEYINQYAEHDRYFGYDLDQTPFIIYHNNTEAQVIEKVSSTIDMAPTIANLFALDYDTRLFLGKDIFSDEENIVIFQSGSWYNQVGYFSSYDSQFTPFNEQVTYSDERIQAINKQVKTTLTIS